MTSGRLPSVGTDACAEFLFSLNAPARLDERLRRAMLVKLLSLKA